MAQHLGVLGAPGALGALGALGARPPVEWVRVSGGLRKSQLESEPALSCKPATDRLFAGPRGDERQRDVVEQAARTQTS